MSVMNLIDHYTMRNAYVMWMLICNEIFHVSILIITKNFQVQQSLYGTTDHDPELGTPLTPTKRQPSQLPSNWHLAFP